MVCKKGISYLFHGNESSDINLDGLYLFIWISILLKKQAYLIAWLAFLPKSFYFTGP